MFLFACDERLLLLVIENSYKEGRSERGVEEKDSVMSVNVTCLDIPTYKLRGSDSANERARINLYK